MCILRARERERERERDRDRATRQTKTGMVTSKSEQVVMVQQGGLVRHVIALRVQCVGFAKADLI
jgi:hypothetical protein